MGGEINGVKGGENMSFVMKRILGLEKKRRIGVYVYLEKELIDLLRENGYSISNTINVALEKYLREKGLLK